MPHTVTIRSLAVLATLAACASPSDPTRNDLTRIDINPGPVTLVSLQQSHQLTATGKTSSGGAAATPGLTWESSAPGVVAVSASGMVTALADGTARVTAVSGEISAEVLVTVARIPATISLSPGDLRFTALNQTSTLAVTARDAGGATMDPGQLLWSSGNPAVATVSASGVVTPVGDGSTTITARKADATASVTVVVARELAGLELAPASLGFAELGKTEQLTVSGRDIGGATMPVANVAWESSLPAVATVSATGLVTAVGQGVTQISATSGTHTVQAAVTVDTRAATVEITGGQSPFKGIDGEIQLTATPRNSLGQSVTAATQWQSSNPAVATVSQAGLVTTHNQGTTSIQATADGKTGTWPLTIQTVFNVPVDPFLATPMANALWEVPVVVVWFLPSRDGVNLDVRKAPDFWTLNPKSLAQMESELMRITRHRKFMVEEGSRFRGYSNPNAPPSLGYRVVKHLIIYDLPPGSDIGYSGRPGTARFVDYHKVFADHDLAAFVSQHGVRELWVAINGFDATTPSYDPSIHKDEYMRTDFESNMSSPTTGDISNSSRWPHDLPVLGHTYIVYNINFRRSQAEAVHNVGHQLEHMLTHVSWLRDGNISLFWRQFVGQDAFGQNITGRAGWTHMPPNTVGNYDYLNPALVASDIADWRPSGGTTAPVNVDTWGNLTFNWPGGPPPGQRQESQWYIYWMQSMPGAGNEVPHGNRWMTNWWAFVADWDAAIQSGLGLHGAGPAAIRGEGVSSAAAARAAQAGKAPRPPVFHREGPPRP